MRTGSFHATRTTLAASPPTSGVDGAHQRLDGLDARRGVFGVEEDTIEALLAREFRDRRVRHRRPRRLDRVALGERALQVHAGATRGAGKSLVASRASLASRPGVNPGAEEVVLCHQRTRRDRPLNDPSGNT
jgi:hypothetical protein